MKDEITFLLGYVAGIVVATLYFTFTSHPSGLFFCAGAVAGLGMVLAWIVHRRKSRGVTHDEKIPAR